MYIGDGTTYPKYIVFQPLGRVSSHTCVSPSQIAVAALPTSIYSELYQGSHIAMLKAVGQVNE